LIGRFGRQVPTRTLIRIIVSYFEMSGVLSEHSSKWQSPYCELE